MIGGSGEQLTLRAVARWADACNLFGDPATVKSKLDILRGHCEKEKMKLPDPFRGFALTVPQVIDLVGGYQDVGSQLMIVSSYKNDAETLELFAGEVMPKFA